MNISDIINQNFSVEKQVILPFTCLSGFCIIQSPQIRFHLLIDDLIKYKKLDASSYTDVYQQLSPKSRVQLAQAFLEHSLFLEKNNTIFTQVPELSNGLAAAFPFFRQEDEAFMLLVLKSLLARNKKTAFPGQKTIIKSIHTIYSQQSIPTNISNALHRWYIHLQDLKTSIPLADFDENQFPETEQLLQQILKIESPLERFKKLIDPQFSPDSLVKYLRDGFPLSENDPFFEAHLDIHALVAGQLEGWEYGEAGFKNQQQYRSLLTSKQHKRKEYVMALIYRICWTRMRGGNQYDFYWLLNDLIRQALDFTEAELIFILNLYVERYLTMFQITDFYTLVTHYISKNGVSPTLSEALEKFIEIKGQSSEKDKQLVTIKEQAQLLLKTYNGNQNS